MSTTRAEVLREAATILETMALGAEGLPPRDTAHAYRAAADYLRQEAGRVLVPRVVLLTCGCEFKIPFDAKAGDAFGPCPCGTTTSMRLLTDEQIAAMKAGDELIADASAPIARCP